MGRILALVVALFALSSAPALASGTLTVNVVGVGAVDGSVECSRTSVGLPATSCSKGIFDRIVCSETGACFTIPASASLTATPGSGFVFSGWSGSCSGTGACAPTMPSNKTVTATFTDTLAPTVTLLTPANGAKLHGDVRLTASAADNSGVVDHVVFKLDDRSVTDTAAPFEAVISSTRLDGTVKATATAFDGAGKSLSDSATVLIDNVAPTLKVTGPDGDTFGPGTKQTWSLDASDASSGVASVLCSVVPAGAPAVFGACAGGASGHSVVNKPGGSYVFTARATDGAGNTLDVARPFVIDATPPVTSVSGGVDDGATTADTAFTWSFSASEAASFACRVYPAALTPGDFAPCSADASHTASGFAPGVYAFEVRATDAFGNVESAPGQAHLHRRPAATRRRRRRLQPARRLQQRQDRATHPRHPRLQLRQLDQEADQAHVPGRQARARRLDRHRVLPEVLRQEDLQEDRRLRQRLPRQVDQEAPEGRHHDHGHRLQARLHLRDQDPQGPAAQVADRHDPQASKLPRRAPVAQLDRAADF